MLVDVFILLSYNIVVDNITREYIKMIKIWVDDEREMPEGYDDHLFTVASANAAINICYNLDEDIFISLDHDAGGYANHSGDYIQILNILEFKSHEDLSWKDYIKNKIAFHLHTANPVGRDNMRRIIQKNGWREV